MEHLLTWLDEERGRRLALAAFLKISPPALSMWDRIPAERVRAVEEHTGISRVLLRPDLYAEAA